jgi:hypothetical protein
MEIWQCKMQNFRNCLILNVNFAFCILQFAMILYSTVTLLARFLG